MHIHLDPVGGLAGDMFVAALLDTWPELEASTLAAIRLVDLTATVPCELQRFNDGVLSGCRFSVHGGDGEQGEGHDSADDGVHHTGHQHWAGLRQMLEQCALSTAVKHHALGIFTELARAEARVHGTTIDEVVFHEVGHWDSVADIVGAATLIDALSACTWSVGSLPIGRGRVHSVHGELPVPAPATSVLLSGFPLHDDGRDGERVTPTGAAILRYLSPQLSIGARPRTLDRTGFGFGSRRLVGISNVLRVLSFDTQGLVDEAEWPALETERPSGTRVYSQAASQVASQGAVQDASQVASQGARRGAGQVASQIAGQGEGCA